MSGERSIFDKKTLLDYFERGASPREDWQVGMELEKLGRRVSDGAALPYDGQLASIRGVLEEYAKMRGGTSVMEGDHLIGLDADWGTLSLEPGGQVEWSSRPRQTLAALEQDLEQHQSSITGIGERLGVNWLQVAVDPDLSLEAMNWMPKARYKIMRPYLGSRGSLAQRMMTQTASIQCAFDYADHVDWARKFRAAALVAPIATALFANSSRVDGADSGYRSYRQKIWRETDPDRCGLPAIVFEPGFSMERWLDWVLDVPTIFRHRGRGLAPTGGTPFRRLTEKRGCDSVRPEDWETHASTIFTEVRSYTYIEIRSADLQPDELAFSVPSFWAGLLYQEDALEHTLQAGSVFDGHDKWSEAMEVASRSGLAGRVGGTSIGDLTLELLQTSIRGLRNGAACANPDGSSATALERLAARHGMDVTI